MQNNNRDIVYDSILQDITEGRIRPGDVLNERALMERFGVARSVVRDALVDLCNEKVLRSLPRFGYELVALTEGEIRSVMQYRILLEVGNLPLVVKNAKREELAALYDKMQKVRYTNAEDVWSDWKINTDFHLSLHALCGNPYCYDQIKRCLSIQKRVFAQYFWDKWQRVRIHFSNERHLMVMEALLDHDVGAAQRCLEEDLVNFGSCLMYTEQ